MSSSSSSHNDKEAVNGRDAPKFANFSEFLASLTTEERSEFNSFQPVYCRRHRRGEERVTDGVINGVERDRGYDEHTQHFSTGSHSCGGKRGNKDDSSSSSPTTTIMEGRDDGGRMRRRGQGGRCGGTLYIGPVQAARWPPLLKRFGITHVLSVMGEESIFPVLPDDFQTLKIRIEDEKESNITQFFPQTCLWIDEALGGGDTNAATQDTTNTSISSMVNHMGDDDNDRDKNIIKDDVKQDRSHNSGREKGRPLFNNVLVHCVAGRSRSASLIAAFLMLELRCSAVRALEIVRSARRFVHPNIGFVSQLQKWEQTLEKEGHYHHPHCELCELTRRDAPPSARRTQWFQEQPRFMVVECDQCDAPMAVYRRHTMELSIDEANEMEEGLRQTAEYVYGTKKKKGQVGEQEIDIGSEVVSGEGGVRRRSDEEDTMITKKMKEKKMKKKMYLTKRDEWVIDKRQRSILTHAHWHARSGNGAVMARLWASLATKRQRLGEGEDKRLSSSSSSSSSSSKL